MEDDLLDEGYIEATVIVEGALDEERTFARELDLYDWSYDLIKEALVTGTDTSVYVLFHEHPELPDCSCNQYGQDHRPYMSTSEGFTPIFLVKEEA